MRRRRSSENRHMLNSRGSTTPGSPGLVESRLFRRKSVRTTSICFVTGTRAEFGLMQNTLRAIGERCRLRIVVTGMHLSQRHGRSINEIRKQWKIDAIIPWKNSTDQFGSAQSAGRAIAELARAFQKLRPDIVLVVGDRVEAFAAAAAAHIAGVVVAHIHGGDRALGQVDDSLRHAITKLAHIHFPATLESAKRIKKLGEQSNRIHLVGSPGIDGITRDAITRVELRKHFPALPRQFGLLIVHPAGADESLEFRRAEMIYRVARKNLPHLVVIYPNNDPGSDGIVRCWNRREKDSGTTFLRNVPRAIFLALLRDAAMLLGNSSSGIIEAASFRTSVLDIGPRQSGREHGGNVAHVSYESAAIEKAIKKIWNAGHPRRYPRKNIYGRGNAAEKMASVLATIPLTDSLRHKLIAY